MDEKVKAFVDRIMEECEQEGFTLAEVTAIAVQFDTTVSSRICDIKAETKFTSLKEMKTVRAIDEQIPVETSFNLDCLDHAAAVMLHLGDFLCSEKKIRVTIERNPETSRCVMKREVIS